MRPICCCDQPAAHLRQQQLPVIISNNEVQGLQLRSERPRDGRSFRSSGDLTKRHPFLADEGVLFGSVVHRHVPSELTCMPNNVTLKPFLERKRLLRRVCETRESVR